MNHTLHFTCVQSAWLIMLQATGKQAAVLRMWAATITFLLFLQVFLPAQRNLVPNPGFDNLEFCPNLAGQIISAMPWRAAQATPDLFHACALSPEYSTPYPFQCNYLPPHNGEGYIGITVYGTREFVETTLSEPLVRGKAYYIRFFVAPDEDCQGFTPGFSDAIALMLKRTDDPTGSFETVAEHSGQVISDTMNWTKISRCYFAQGTERDLKIGNPKSDVLSTYETTEPDYPYPENYMFVDDVFVGAFNPLPDTVLLCNGMPVQLDATFLESTYQWNTGATSAVLMAADTGRYTVQAEIDGCFFRDTVIVIRQPTIPPALGDSAICQGEKVILRAPMPGFYTWSDGTNEDYVVVEHPGQYSVTVTNNCGVFQFNQQVEAAACRCQLYVPNIFTPNGDGNSDLLELSIGCLYPYDIDFFEVYDRWGNQVFSSRSNNPTAWDGLYKGEKALPGVYVWQLQYKLNRNGATHIVREQGDVTLLR